MPRARRTDLATRLRVGGALAAAVLLALFSAAACVPDKPMPSPIIIVVTFPPTAAPSATATPTPTPTESMTEPPTPVVVGSPSPAPTASAPSTPIAMAPVPASTCAGTASNKAFWAEAAKNLTWGVYCPVLPSGWAVKSGSYDAGSPGSLSITYAGPGNVTFAIKEGAYCTTGAAACAPEVAEIGTASLGNLSGTLGTVTGGFAIYVNPGTTLAYSVTGTGMSQDAVVSMAAAMVLVAR